ncbi:carcinoembryonic antigen-related cell adhesion molecule 3-like [Acomys russatus]|uniref:carcinoembryonic antigen-related cell adhesion molecule 3-like n=1 Tax=Acomys russatus TaxID=60746 RepID=UPI0021E2610D|nr:carcinoembryonic antigen-related cell adhesion molecule 3-like [Acomys russatus]
MVESAALLCKGCTSWHGLLLTASLLTYWLPPTTAKITIETEPPIALEGQNVLLSVYGLPESVQALSWFTGVMVFKGCEIARYVIANNSYVLGIAHSGRETVLNNGSLLIKNVTRKDSGYYTLQTFKENSSLEITRAEFFVHRPFLGYKKRITHAQLTIELVPSVVDEGDHVFLLVDNLPQKLQGFTWHKGVLPLDHSKIGSHAVLTKSSMLGSKYYGRVTICTDGSLMLWNVTQKDTGLYTIRTISADLKSEWAIMHLQVNGK